MIPRRRLAVALAVLAVLTALAIGTWRSFADGQPSRSPNKTGSASLKPLPPGPPHDDAQAVYGGETLAEMIRNSPVIFIGIAEERGGSEVIPSEQPDVPVLTTHRVRLRVLKVLRGSVDGPLQDITIPDIEGMDTFELERRYLVFAERRTFGASTTAALTSSGYPSGVYELVSDIEATNRANGTVNLKTLSAQLGAEG